MTHDPAITEAAARAMFEVDETATLDETELARASWIVAAIAPLIRDDALEEAATVAEKYRAGAYEARQRIAAAIRALKTSGQPIPKT